ncbi:M15 family metallopeptidase [Tabrizicola sp.]|uniref:M15 family metallopeptidase n=1 Tax=Tabrizicola sp. TaxID=2005166 RepID=UPI003F316C00
MRRLGLLALALTPCPALADPLPAGFVRLSDLAPDIASDIRYARAFNFTGAPVPGYAAAECILSEPTARALIQAEAKLNAEGYGLILFDCYRPTQAVRHFMDWADSEGRELADDIFLPDLDRTELVPGGYIARRSSHSLGVAVDVGLRRLTDPMLYPDLVAGQRCDGTLNERPMDSTLDMGTAFDCFSALSAVSAAVSVEAQQNRSRLREAMEGAGFTGYDAEWWHFRFAADPADTPQDFPVTSAP